MKMRLYSLWLLQSIFPLHCPAKKRTGDRDFIRYEAVCGYSEILDFNLRVNSSSDPLAKNIIFDRRSA
jgi:hypothetical protein